MAQPVVIYYGQDDIESDVFQAWMHTIGFQILVASELGQVFEAFRMYPETITVIKLQESPLRLIQIVKEMRAHADPGCHLLFVLAERPFDLDVPAAQVFARPLRLSHIAKRIQASDPQHA